GNTVVSAVAAVARIGFRRPAMARPPRAQVARCGTRDAILRPDGRAADWVDWRVAVVVVFESHPLEGTVAWPGRVCRRGHYFLPLLSSFFRPDGRVLHDSASGDDGHRPLAFGHAFPELADSPRRVAGRCRAYVGILHAGSLRWGLRRYF